ncbi:tetratricopeptide repeat-containing sensor histidine kinase [Carboxylicivirga linearis]|uniref:histidine kinase n=1 Tax=Carboxylicivirga linearis TaxID=1628157 RepID=A0ABS5JWU1_9BACT|nr:sensor histidine kinase [Carboxylicivirga linearis]MBS2099283.1 sensor histidine kinase [Carboxylicivirga linearis]
MRNYLLRSNTRVLLLILLFLFAANQIKSQDKSVIDSLLNQLPKQTNDSLFIEKLWEVSFAYESYNLDSAAQYALKAINHSKRTENNEYLIRSLITYGNILRDKRSQEKADSILQVAEKVCVGSVYEDNYAFFLFNAIGGLKTNEGKYTEAIEYYLKALKKAELLGDEYYKAATSLDLGVLCAYTDEYDKGLNYYYDSYQYFKEIDDGYFIAASANGLGSIYQLTGEIDSALYYNNIALDYSLKIDNQILAARMYTNLAECYAIQNDYSKSLQAHLDALKIKEGRGDWQDIAISKILVGQTYARMGELAKGLRFIDEGQLMADTLNLPYIQKSALLAKKESYYLNKKYEKAYDYLQKYHELNDSIYSEDVKLQIKELEEKYESEKKDKQLLEQKASLAMSEKKRVQQRNLLLVSVGLLVILAGLVVFTFAYMRQRRKLYNETIANLEKEKELTQLKFVMEGEEKERSRLARELHDGVNGSLGAIKLMASSELKKASDTSDNLIRINQMLDSVSDEVRDISHNLMPDTLLKLGLDEALLKHINKLSETDKINVDFQSYGRMDDLDVTVKLAIYRITQELLKNIIKHAKASEGLVQVNRHQNELSLIVEDNGKGFDVFDRAQKKNWGIGLQNIYNRVEILGGIIDIQSSLDAGTSININLPLN